jgi:predicted Zn finger-like uncharacterized protein
MPEQVRCPSCNAALRVPDSLLGKNVKCPKCQKTFFAAMEEPDELEEVDDEPAPARRSEAMEETEEEGSLEEEEEERRPPRRRRGRRRFAEAEAAVAAPALCLMVLGALNIPTAVAYAIFRFVINKPDAGRAYPPGQAPPGYEAGWMIGTAFAFVIVPLSIILGIVLLIGGLKMKKLQSFGLAMTASVLAMLPIHCCCLLGLPFGIWGLIALNKPQVQNAFR